jgi:hypothetical protein
LTSRVASLSGLVAIAALVSASAAPPVRTVWTSRRGDMLHVRASGVEFVAGPPLARLKDGRSIRVDLTAATAPEANAPFELRTQAQAVLSYDLWEERFAVARVDVKRSISHLTARDAEAWCLEQLVFPVSALRTQSAAFWMRLTYRLQDEDQPAAQEDPGGFTLRGLIDRFSRRAASEVWADTIVSGPIRIE